MSAFDAIKAQAEEAWRQLQESPRPRISLGMGSCGIASGVEKTKAALEKELERHRLDIALGITGCIGACYAEPLVYVSFPAQPQVIYSGIKAEKVPELVEKVLLKGQHYPDLALGVLAEEPMGEIPSLFSLDFFRPQVRRLMVNYGVIDPENIDHYIARGGYAALDKVLTSMQPEEVIAELNKSGLTGRGGAFFPTGRKWDFLRTAPGTTKYLICNADEGDPGAFVNRVTMESDPHSLLEGCLIGAYTMGCQQGYIYLRSEYPLAAQRLQIALQQAREHGLLGENILGTDFSCEIEVAVGAGAYLAGEETGLISSLQDSRAMPRIRPPFPAQAGLWNLPTNVNNVESYVSAPPIILHGGEWYASMGAERLKGTKLFSLSGDIARPGVVEVPFGTPLRAVIMEAGGGVPDGHALKAIQPGGPLGAILPASLLDLPLDREAFAAQGALLGSGGLVIIDERGCIVDLALLLLTFDRDESCARCVTCRIGTQHLVEILERITAGRGKAEDLENMRFLDKVLKNSNCAHGQSATTPIMSGLRFFEAEFKAHIFEKRCPAGVCEALTLVAAS